MKAKLVGCGYLRLRIVGIGVSGRNEGPPKVGPYRSATRPARSSWIGEGKLGKAQEGNDLQARRDHVPPSARGRAAADLAGAQGATHAPISTSPASQARRGPEGGHARRRSLDPAPGLEKRWMWWC